MKSCTFFGHRDCPETIAPALQAAILSCLQEGITNFYVGHQGRFDAMALSCLRRLAENDPRIC